MTIPSNTSSSTSWSLTGNGSLSQAQLNDLTNSGAYNTNIKFASSIEMMNFILYNNISGVTSSGYFDTWETMIATLDTTTNGSFAINTGYVNPNGQGSYLQFKQVQPFIEQFWAANSMYITNIEIKFKLPKTYNNTGSNAINQNSIDPTGAYQNFNVAFYYGAGITIAVPTAVEQVPSPPAAPLQAWYQIINNLILNWRMQTVNSQ